jgi:hypothetical protein
MQHIGITFAQLNSTHEVMTKMATRDLSHDMKRPGTFSLKNLIEATLALEESP